jgi:hypothetical protein
VGQKYAGVDTHGIPEVTGGWLESRGKAQAWDWDWVLELYVIALLLFGLALYALLMSARPTYAESVILGLVPSFIGASCVVSGLTTAYDLSLPTAPLSYAKSFFMPALGPRGPRGSCLVGFESIRLDTANGCCRMETYRSSPRRSPQCSLLENRAPKVGRSVQPISSTRRS